MIGYWYGTPLFALAPEEFFSRMLEDIRKYSQIKTFADDICVVGIQIGHTDSVAT